MTTTDVNGDSAHREQDTVSAQSSLDEKVDGEKRAQGGISIQGDGSVAAGGDITDSTVVTGNRNIVNSTVNYITHASPATLYQDAKRLFTKYRWCILGVVAVDILFLLAYQTYRDRFLLSWLTYSGLALLLSVVVWNWIILCRPGQLRTQRRLLYATGAATLLWFSLTTVEVRAKVYPPQFDDEQFGIAIATFSEGGDFRISSRSQQMTAIIADELDEQIRTNRQLSGNVDVKVIGSVRNLEEGLTEGRRVGAKLVIWGQVLGRDEGIRVSFHVLQSPELIDNPAFPQTLPSTPHSFGSHFTLPADESEMASTRGLAVAAFSLGLYYYNKPDFVRAVQQFKTSLDHLERVTKPTDGSDMQLAYYYLGKSYQQVGNIERSYEMLNEVLAIDPDDVAALIGQSYNYRMMGKPARSGDTLNKVITLTKELELFEGTRAVYNRAIAYEGLGKYEDALREYRAILQEDPNFFIAYISAGRILRKPLKRYEEAENLYEDAVALAKDRPKRLVWLASDRGKLYELMGDPQKALQMYDEAIALDPELVPAYFYRAEFYESQENLNAALSDYQQVVEYSDQRGWARGVLAKFLSSTGDYPGAIETYLQALRYDYYDKSRLRVELALTYFAASEQDVPNRIELARQQFEQALQNPGPSEAYIRSNYGYMLEQIGSRAEAIQQFEYSLSLNPDIDASTMLNLAALYEMTGQKESAKFLYQSIVESTEDIESDKRQEAQARLRRLDGD